MTGPESEMGRDGRKEPVAVPPLRGLRSSRRGLLKLGAASAVAGLAGLHLSEQSAIRAEAAEAARQVLPNGLVVIVEERRTAETLAVQLTARNGSRDDRDQPGVSVLTSRVMFQGTTRRPSETELQRAAAAVGGTLTRGTTIELSSYTAVVPSREARIAFDLVSDIVLNALLDPAALERQKQIALQDLARRRADPNAYIDELFQRAIFAGHPASIPVLGTPETISGLSPDSIAGTRARFWAASNLALTIAGRIRPDEALALAAEYFGNLFSGSANVRAPATPTGSPFGDAVRATAGRQQAVFRVGYLAPSLLDDDRYPMAVLNAVTSGSSGRLFREIRSARGLAYVAGSGYSPLSDTGAWFATAGVDPDNLDAALSVTRDLIEQLREQAPSSGETSDRQGEIAGRQILADETNEARVGRLASQELLGTVATDEYVRRVRAVTPDDVLRVATTYLDPSSALVVIVQPESTSPTGPP